MRRTPWLVLFLIAAASFALLADDHGNSALTATAVDASGGLIAGCIETAGDMDYFLFSADKGRSYRLLTSHLSAEMDTVLYLLGSEGVAILLVDDNSGGEMASRIQWTCPASGTYFVMVRHARSTTGTGCYDVSLSIQVVDDHGDDTLSATPLSTTAVPASGFIETADDADVFLFSVTRGYQYVARLTGTTAGAEIDGRLLGADGLTVLAAFDGTATDDLKWTAPTDGTLFIDVRAAPGSPGGGYELTLTQTGYADDFGGTPAAARPIDGRGQTVAGSIDVLGDQDWFAFSTRQGTEYRLTVSGEEPPRLALVASDGSTLVREETAAARSSAKITWVAPSEGTFYLVVEEPGATGAYALTVSSTLQLELVSSFNPQGYSLDVAVRDGIVFLVVGTKGLLIVDIRDPLHPREIGAHSTRGYAQSVAVDGDFAFVANRGEGLTVLDVSDPSRPFEAGSIDTAGSVQDVVVHQGIAYVADQRGGLLIVDVTRPEGPAILATVETDGFAEAVEYADGIVYVAVGDAGLQVVDVSDPRFPASLGSLNLPGDASDVAVVGRFVYVAAGFRGIRIVDVGDPAAPIEVGALSTAGEVTGLCARAGFLYAAERTEGLAVFSLSDPTRPELTGRIDTPGEAVQVAVTDEFACIADREKGLQIVRLYP